MHRMPYSQKTLQQLEKAADQVPPGIQLEVNAEIFVTVRNMLVADPQSGSRKQRHMERLGELIRRTVAAIAEIEERRGYGISVEEQVAMLEEALAIMDVYLPEIFFEEIAKPDIDFVPPAPESTYDRAQADFVFATRVWPIIAGNKPKNVERPIAYLIGGQPGSGKSRMASTVIDNREHQLIHGDPDTLFGFHPHYQELQEKYGLYSIYITQHFADYMAEKAFQQAVAERRYLLIESNCTDPEEILAKLKLLQDSGYYVIVKFRATPRLESWQSLQQLYQQQLIKAPALARMMSPEYHDWACDKFVETALAVHHEHRYDRLVVKSEKGLLYDSDDSPTESVAELLRERLRRGEEE
ncbi:hypothetical protein HMPREF1633_02010 [Tissierellia bacterium S5-A11]|nr:hypothetical protein HMPREF1633_02010 [Tissierellia bacterium S5-A11]